MRTNLKSERMPAKPYFEYTPSIGGSAAKFRWYPCGRERICNGQESGTHFGITIKEPYNTRKWNTVTKEELYLDYITILFWPGVLYEVVPYSINGGYKTDSDSLEIYMEPTSTPVQYVNIISLPDLSTLISWKPPKHSLNKQSLSIYFYYFNLSDPEGDVADQVVFQTGVTNKKREKKFTDVISPYKQMRILDLKPEVMYTYVLIPVWKNGSGFQYRKKHELQVYNQGLQIAKPDVNHEFKRNTSYSEVEACRFYFQWLPCGLSFDCGNSKPGSNYSFYFRPDPLRANYKNKYGYYEGYFSTTGIYKVTLTSSFGNQLSEPVTKIFKNCDEIREDRPLKEDQN